MAINLVKPGQVVNLDKGLRHLTVGLKWGGSKGGGLLKAIFGGVQSRVDVDSSIIVVGKGRKLDRIYFGRKVGRGIIHAGDDLTGNDKRGKEDNEEIYLTLPDIDPQADELYVVANIFSGASDFSKVKGSYMRLINKDNGEELVRYELAEFKGMGGVVLGKIYLRDGGWRFKAIGEGVQSSNLSSIEAAILANK